MTDRSGEECSVLDSQQFLSTWTEKEALEVYCSESTSNVPAVDEMCLWRTLRAFGPSLRRVQFEFPADPENWGKQSLGMMRAAPTLPQNARPLFCVLRDDALMLEG